MHGYEPGSVVPTTELLLSHKHPEDRDHVQDLLDQALHQRSSFSSRHRFLDTAGNVHDAIVVADRMADETGAVVGTAGYYIDLTATFVETRQVALDEVLPDLFESARGDRAGQRCPDGRLPGQRGASLQCAEVAVAGDQHQIAGAGQAAHRRNRHAATAVGGGAKRVRPPAVDGARAYSGRTQRITGSPVRLDKAADGKPARRVTRWIC